MKIGNEHNDEKRTAQYALFEREESFEEIVRKALKLQHQAKSYFPCQFRRPL
ncbi:hypothetical protein VS868_00350 [Salinimicrobium sp. 3283s]|uniref:hypothetical protein n=1 Tax=Salinimicrobium sp. 3283s TaxID=3114359 RepID=UPI0031E5374F